MINRYHRRLSLPVRLLNVDLTATSVISSYTLDKEPEFLDFLSSLGLAVYTTEKFYLAPGTVLPIHTDQDNFNDCVKLNFVYCDGVSTTSWYEPKPDTVPVVNKTPIGTYYTKPADISDIVKVYEIDTVGTSLLNVGHYHGVTNGDSARVTISIKLKDSTTDREIFWDDAIERFNAFFV